MPSSCHPSALTTWIQEKEWCHPSAPTLGWLCCIASYDGLKIKKMENISSLLFWYL
ncbi:hypothetical protein [Wolbachia endosymbiont (group A) of Rhinocyllus conicus]|uniref:hypothetical protein n=1 Tax=Wolbachia endosymbiont (group A) of Rhinocyllus conicus TaxID=2954053 RepID=UPI002227CF86|nr:hypothetical protein [Wolbachia endosymbiont (group A) of Rhinocyllus conicus]